MKKNTCKKGLALLLALVTAFSLVGLSGCGKTVSTVTENAELEEAILNATSIELVRMMGNGINLGNTMEAYGHTSGGISAAVSYYETCWSQPITTQEMIQGMKDAGFDTLRIPVAWTNMMDFENGDYTINTAYLDRVQEIVDWAIEAEMYVIVNDHWDGGWWGKFGSATEETVQQAWDMYEAIWTQNAERFADYSYLLIFESANEELGSGLNSTTFATDSGQLSIAEQYELTNQINQKFVDIIRSSGGKNENRFLLIAGMNTNIEDTCDEAFVMPTDTVEDKLLVSVHFYSPWNFCAEDQETDTSWGTVSEFADMVEQLEMMLQYTEAGIGVVLGEYGAMPLADGSYKSDMNTYHQAILDLCTMYDICPILWDRGDFYSKTDCKLGDETMAQLYASRSYATEQDMDFDTVKAQAEEDFNALVAAAPEEAEKEEIDVTSLSDSMAWIMWNSGYTYSVGDTYNPSDCTAGLIATDAEITGEGTYTISLDFTGTESGSAWGITFSAIGISNAEILYPGYYIDIVEILVNGEAIELVATPYTSSDDGLCTRVNIYYQWIKKLPDDARTVSGDLSDASPIIISTADFARVDTLEITFRFVAP